MDFCAAERLHQGLGVLYLIEVDRDSSPQKSRFGMTEASLSRFWKFRDLSWRNALLTLQFLAFDLQQLGVQLGSNKNRDTAHVQPEHERDDRADRPISLVVVGKIRDVDVHGEGNQNPQTGPDNGSGQAMFESLFHIGT